MSRLGLKVRTAFVQIQAETSGIVISILVRNRVGLSVVWSKKSNVLPQWLSGNDSAKEWVKVGEVRVGGGRRKNAKMLLRM